MSLLHSQSFKSLPCPIPSPQIPIFLTPKPHTLKKPRNPNPIILYCTNSQRPTVPTTEQQVLEAIAYSDEKTLPCVRTYEDDVARLTLVGVVEFQQALTAAASDGGEAARQHVDSGIPAMVVETVFPGSGGDQSTVSTRLFLPAKKVKEKASRLKKSFSEDILNSMTSKNILAMTFRQVVLQQLWSFQLVSFVPGTERNMEDLESPREVAAAFTLSSSNDQAISSFAEAICDLSLQSTKDNFLHGLSGSSESPFRWFRKIKKFSSKDSSVVVHQLSEDEVLQNAETMLQSFNSSNGFCKHFKSLPKNFDWTPQLWSKLESIAGPEFSAWVSQYVPTYKLQVDANYVEDLKFEGWRKLMDNRWEVLLTNSQMVGLANILDMFYDDIYTLPWKELPCHMVVNPSTLSSKKWGYSLSRMLSIVIAGGIFLVAIGAFRKIALPHLKKEGKHHLEFKSVPSSVEVSYAHGNVLDSTKMQELCSSVVKKIKDAFGWADDIVIEADIGSWVGELPSYLRNSSEANSDATSSSPSETESKLSLQDIASYQVVLSSDGKIAGFQPMSRVAVNHWATNPLAKELYGGKNLSPGFIEPSLKIQRPNEIVVLELLVSVNPDANFALVRPFQ